MPTDVPPKSRPPQAKGTSASSAADLHGRGDHTPERFRMLPASEVAERGVVCSFLLAPSEVGGMCAEQEVTIHFFHNPALGTIFSVLMEMWDASKKIDLVTLTQTLADRRLLEQVGGAALIAELFTYLPTATNVKYYLDILQEKYTLRQIITVCTEFASRSYEEQDNVGGLLDEVEKSVFEVAQQRFRNKETTMKEHVMGAIGSIQDLFERRGVISGIPSGFAVLDKMTDGFHPGEMIVIAARPSMGKTAFAMNIAEHVAVDCNEPVAVFSLEMSAQQLVQRLLCSRAKVNLENVRKGFMAEREFPALTAAASKFAEAQMFIDDTSGLSILELRAKARRLKSQHNIKAIFIDYLQLLRSTSRRAQDNRQLEIAEISAGLKGLAKELELPIIVLAQLNRNPEGRTGEAKGRPRLGDLRESGSIEQDADLVGLLIRDEYYADTEEAKEAAMGKATLIIAKQRNGPVGDVKLTFLKEFTRFETRAETDGE
ncbi:MAG TPA: replicative DNA helicase [Chthoniobacteraceae bacterium]|nr:replicative DNA helicase [Chthoniobacteraceae bacterium]